MKRIRKGIVPLTILILIATLATYLRLEYYIDVPAGQKIVIMKSRDVGIGNQLFRFASAYALAKRMEAQLWIVARDYNYSSSSDFRGFALDKFNISYDRLISPKQYIYIKKMMKTIQVNEENFFDVTADLGQIFAIEGSDKGRFESEKYFHDRAEEISKITLKQTLPRTELVQSIRNSESVAVHIRHGDFGSDRIIPITYQIQAMQEMRRKLPNSHFFIFSDDVRFIRDAFSNLKDITVASEAKMSSLDELQLMSNCKHIITANSTFSWWAAYLIQNPKKIVIAPAFYADFGVDDEARRKFYADDFYLKSWITMDPFELNWPAQ